MSVPSGDIRPDLSSQQLVQGPRALRILAALLAALFAVSLVGLVAIPWQQNVSGIGRVVAFDPFDRIQTIAAPVNGRIDNAWVIEGSHVEKGDPLLQIVDNDPSILQRLEEQRRALEAQLAATESKVAVLEEQVEALAEARQLAIDAARSQLEGARASVESARFGFDAARASEQQARLNYQRQKELFEEGLASGLEFEVAERVFREAVAKREQAAQALSGTEFNLAAKQADLGQVGTSAQARIESARASRQSAEVEASALRERVTRLEVTIAQQNTQRIVAPRSGTVFRLFAAPGAELVKAGDRLLQLIPDTDERAVELWVDGNDVPLIEPGRSVRLQFEGWPAVQFSGWPSVAVGTFAGQVALVDTSDDGAGRFRLLVAPDVSDEPWPESTYLRQGVRAKGFILLDRVSLGYELWRQANGFPPTVAMRGSGPQNGSPPAEKN